MFRKKNRKKHSRAMLSAYSIIMILIILLGILSHALPKPQYTAAVLEDETTSEEISPVESEEEILTTDEVVVDDEVLNSGEEATILEEVVVADEAIATDEAVSDEEELVAIAESTEAETFDSLEACEEVYGEEGCAIVDGSGVVGAKLYQILMAPILGFADAIDVCIFVMLPFIVSFG